MGSDQVAAVRPAIVEVLEAASAGDPSYFARFEVSDNSDLWVEVAMGTLNFRFFSAQNPVQHLHSAGVTLPDTATLEAWQPNVFAGFRHNETSPMVIARLVDSLFTQVLAAGADYPVDVSILRFAR